MNFCSETSPFPCTPESSRLWQREEYGEKRRYKIPTKKEHYCPIYIRNVSSFSSSPEQGLSLPAPARLLFPGFHSWGGRSSFLSDACAIKGKQLTGQLLALPVCFVA